MCQLGFDNSPENIAKADAAIAKLERRLRIQQQFKEKHLLDAMESLGDAIEALTEEDENLPLWKQVGVAREMIRAKLQTVCKHDWIPESAANGWRSKCRKCWLEAAGSCQ